MAGRKLYIKVVFEYNRTTERERLQGYALTRTAGDPLVDEDILEHFPPDTPGVDIDACAKEFHGATETEWKGTICNEVG